MSDLRLAFLLIACTLTSVAAVWYFKTLEGNLWKSWRSPLIGGLAAGILLRLTGLTQPASIALALTLIALYVRLTGRESEPVDGMLLGAVCGAAAAADLVLAGGNECRTLSVCLIAGSVAGYGSTFASFHVVWERPPTAVPRRAGAPAATRLRRALIDTITAGAAIALSWLVAMLRNDRAIAIAVAAAIPLIGIATVFREWADIRAELSHEASLGFIDDADVRRTAHPLLRLGRGGWADRKAHREFVRLANKIALRKRQQRNRPDEIARLYQVEIIKLRMQIREMSRIDREVVAGSQPADLPSDTIPGSQ